MCLCDSSETHNSNSSLQTAGGSVRCVWRRHGNTSTNTEAWGISPSRSFQSDSLLTSNDWSRAADMTNLCYRGNDGVARHTLELEVPNRNKYISQVFSLCHRLWCPLLCHIQGDAKRFFSPAVWTSIVSACQTLSELHKAELQNITTAWQVIKHTYIPIYIYPYRVFNSVKQ